MITMSFYIAKSHHENYPNRVGTLVGRDHPISCRTPLQRDSNAERTTQKFSLH
jgi:hypothetical protein